MATIAGEGSRSGKGCMINIIVKELTKSNNERANKIIADEIKEKCVGKSAPEIKKMLLKDVKGMDTLDEKVLDELVADLAGNVKITDLEKIVKVGDQQMSYEDVKKELAKRYEEFVKKKLESIPKVNDKLLPLELKFDAYGKLQQDSGDNLTPHHMPANIYMLEKFKIKFRKSMAMNLESIVPGEGGRHKRTFTYGFGDRDKDLYMALEPEDALDFDIQDLKRILKEDGLYDDNAKTQLKKFVDTYVQTYPNIFKNKPVIDFD